MTPSETSSLPSPGSTQILGFDPGRDKCGLALIQVELAEDGSIPSGSQGIPLHREVVSSVTAIDHVQDLWRRSPFQVIVLGNQTTAKHWQQHLIDRFPTCPIVFVDERNSSLEAQQRFWDYYRPQGWNRLLPRGLRVPPHPYDDLVALILVERYLADPSHPSALSPFRSLDR